MNKGGSVWKAIQIWPCESRKREEGLGRKSLLLQYNSEKVSATLMGSL